MDKKNMEYMVVDDKGFEYSGNLHLDPETVIEECGEAYAKGPFRYSIVVREYNSNDTWVLVDMERTNHGRSIKTKGLTTMGKKNPVCIEDGCEGCGKIVRAGEQYHVVHQGSGFRYPDRACVCLTCARIADEKEIADAPSKKKRSAVRSHLNPTERLACLNRR